MRVLIINLGSEPARMAFQQKQMQALGLNWKRLEAVTPQTLGVPPTDPRWRRWQRPLRAVEVAILASHIMAWEHVIAANSPQLIVEDDVLLAAGVPTFLQQLEHEVRIDHVTLEVRNQKKLVGKRHAIHPIRRLYQDRSGAAAYVLWPSGARMLRSSAAVRPALTDALIATTYELNSWQADPALAIQLDKCDAYGLALPLITTSSVTEIQCDTNALYRARRISGQVRLGLRFLAKAAVSKHRRIALAPNWPVLPSPRDSK